VLPPLPRRGICCCGSWIVDHVKLVNLWPQEETLADILAEETGTGGSAYNVSLDVARFAMGVPLSGLGLVGDDEDGSRILADAARFGIDTRRLLRLPGTPTAYTDVMTVQSTGRRTFFHQRGASALLGPEHFPLAELECGILTLGYLLLLDALDRSDPEHGTAAARVLAGCRAAGILTAVDVVSEDSDRFRRVLTPALPHTDCLLINEIEAGRTTETRIRSDGVLDRRALAAAARRLLELGVQQLVVIHAPEGALGLTRAGSRVWSPSLELPAGFIKGSAGAGDAFFAGMVAGIHEGWSLERCMAFAHGAAACSLRHPTCTAGVGSAEEIWALREQFPPKESR
jgi:sugar/nucleoside kinase (ribokinase family)